MDACDAEDLGSFESCMSVNIPEFDDVVIITNRVTNWCGTFDDGQSIGELTIGDYAAEFNSVLYIFTVV